MPLVGPHRPLKLGVLEGDGDTTALEGDGDLDAAGVLEAEGDTAGVAVVVVQEPYPA